MGEGFKVSPEQIAAYDEDGAVLLKNAIDPEWQDLIRSAIEKELTREEKYFSYRHLWRHNPDFKHICFDSPAATIAADIMQTDKVNLLYDQMFVKEPGTGSATGWHNDQPYWPVRGWSVMTVWIALDPVTRDNGPLEFIRGSHKWDRWFQPFQADAHGGAAAEQPEPNPNYEPLPDFEAERDQHDIISWDMEPGDALAFHAMSMHGARGNTSAALRRRGLAIRYTGRDATYFLDDHTASRRGDLHSPLLKTGDPMDSDEFPVVYGG